MTCASVSVYFGVSSVVTFASTSSLSASSFVTRYLEQGSQQKSSGNGPQCAVCAKPVDRFKFTDAGSMNVLVVAYCHTEEEARVMPRDNLGIVAVPKGYVAFTEKARVLMVETIPVERPTVRLISLEEDK